MSPPIDPVDLGIVNRTVSVRAMNQPFPQIYEPFVKGNGVINQSWLQLLIALWNRTGYAPGASSEDALNLASTSSDELSVAGAEQNAILAAFIQDSVQAEIIRLGLEQQFAPRSDPLEALLFMDASGSGSATAAQWCMQVISAPAGYVLDGSEECGTLFING